MIELRVPGDKSISHRALLLAALARGQSRIRGILPGEDPRSTAAVLRALGVPVPPLPRDGSEMRVTGKGIRGLMAPSEALDCGNSGTTARLLLGVLAGQELEATVTGDASLRVRPMARVTDPLTSMGARFESLASPGRLPLLVRGGTLRGIEYAPPMASAQVKSAILLAGLTGGVAVEVTEPGWSRDHTERMLTMAGCAVRSTRVGDGNRVVLASPPDELLPVDLTVPGDFSSAAYFLALGLLGGAGEGIVVRDVGLNPTRTGLLEVLRRMGADVDVSRTDPGGGEGEPRGDVLARPSELVGATVAEDEIPGLIDEIPVVAVLAASARGETRITGAAELRHKESDRLATMASNLQAIGVAVEELEEGLVIEGAPGPFSGRVRAHGDHRVAMALGILAALPGAAIEVDGREVVEVSYPGFWDDLGSAAGGASAAGGGSASPRADSLTVVIDGPAGSGKSTTAQALAERLGYRHLDSGALYRALTYVLLESGVAPETWPELGAAELDRYDIDVAPGPGGFVLSWRDEALGEELRAPRVTAHVSDLAKLPAVRAWLLDRQREARALGPLVADGRDMGTVVFPDADVKVFLVAELRERARRRVGETDPAAGGSAEAVDAEAERLRGRDEQDASRAVAPLRQADDAVRIDTTRLAFEEQVDAILDIVRARLETG